MSVPRTDAAIDAWKIEDWERLEDICCVTRCKQCNAPLYKGDIIKGKCDWCGFEMRRK